MGIILGNKGETIKAVSMTARRELSEMLERTVHFVFASQSAARLAGGGAALLCNGA